MERVTRLVYIFFPSGKKIKVSMRSSPHRASLHWTDALNGSSLRYTKEKTVPKWERFYGAGDEARTRYLHLGKVALYRMSYTRNGHGVL